MATSEAKGSFVGEVRLPRWIVAKKTLPGGWRMGKKPTLPVEAPVKTGRGTFWNTIFGPSNFGRGPAPKNEFFDAMEYRFWAADLDDQGKPTICECRACNSMIMSKINRAVHIGEQGCAKRLVAAYKLLLRDQLCVICNQKTKESKWGVPLCSGECIRKWMNEETQPQCLYEALALVGEIK